MKYKAAIRKSIWWCVRLVLLLLCGALLHGTGWALWFILRDVVSKGWPSWRQSLFYCFLAVAVWASVVLYCWGHRLIKNMLRGCS